VSFVIALSHLAPQSTSKQHQLRQMQQVRGISTLQILLTLFVVAPDASLKFDTTRK
jgi:hypothetical protein